MAQRSAMSPAIWLARKEIVRLRYSYLMTGAFMLVAGAFVAPTVEAGVLGPAAADSPRDAIFGDFVILLLTTLLATNYAFWGSVSEWSNPSERKLAFMRALPIPVSTLVGSRMISMVAALPITIPAFFLSIYLLADVQMGVGDYIAFSVFWVGYALLWAGFNLYVEIVSGSRFYFWISFVSVALMVGLIALIDFGLDIRIGLNVVTLIDSYGFLAALASLVVGFLALMLAGRMAARGLQGREIPA